MAVWAELTSEKIGVEVFENSKTNGKLIFNNNLNYFLIITKSFCYSMHSLRLIFNSDGNLIILYK